MTRDHFRAAKEVQLNQLPEGTEIQVRPVPLAFAYKKLDGRWTPMESHLGVYGPLVGDEFSLGSIAIDPNGNGFVKGFAGCPQHPASTQCLCMRHICWLRVDLAPHPPLPLPDDLAAHPAGPDEDIPMGAVMPAQEFHAGFAAAEPDPPNVDSMKNYPPRPYLTAEAAYDHSTGHGNSGFNYHDMSGPGTERPSFVALAPGGSSEEVHRVFNGLQMSGTAPFQQQHPSDAVDDDLQDVRPMAVSTRYTIYFNREDGGIPLTLRGIQTLNRESPAFEHDVSLGIKASFRFRFKYWQNIPDLREHVDKRKQVNVRHSNKHGNPISLRAMAELVLSELTAEMKTMADLNHPLRHRGAPVQVEQLVLVRIERIKTGTLQPIFMLRR